MSIITISRGTCSGGAELAEKVAKRLGYGCFGTEVLNEAADRYDLPQVEISKVFEHVPSLWDRFTESKRIRLILVKAVMCELAEKGNMVYHGHAGQELLRGIRHVLKVLLVTPPDYRVRLVQERCGVSAEEAAKQIAKMDDDRARRIKYFFDKDCNDPSLYDLVVNVEMMSFDTAADLVVNTVQAKDFQPTEESVRALSNMGLASRVRAALVVNVGTSHVAVNVTADDGVVTLGGSISSSSTEKEILEAVRAVEGVKRLENSLIVNPGYQSFPWS